MSSFKNPISQLYCSGHRPIHVKLKRRWDPQLKMYYEPSALICAYCDKLLETSDGYKTNYLHLNPSILSAQNS
jgi:hypothetical protein